MGSPAVAARIAHLAFWGLLGYGWLWEELKARGVVAFLILWAAGLSGLSFLPHRTALFSSFVAVLDIALVFIIFKGDVRLT